MEKLQAALENARKDRGHKARPTSVPRRTTTRVLGGAIDDYWTSLVPGEVRDAHLDSHRVVTRTASPVATPFDILRTKVLLQMRQNGWRRLAITSPMPQSGKTTTACNLALGIGRQRDMRAILMDFDLRNPSVSSLLNLRPKHNIGEVLTGEATFADNALRVGENVACAMANQPDVDPTRLLLAEETAEVIDRIETTYKPDVMIFDLPSMLMNDDTRAFLKNVDCALIVIRANTTRYSQFDTCEREIAEHTNVLGVVLNAYTHGNPKQNGD